MSRYRVEFNTGKPVGAGSVTPTSRGYRIETDAGPHGAVALAVAEHRRRRPEWPISNVWVYRRGALWLPRGAVPRTGIYPDRSARLRVTFPASSYVVATWRGDLYAVVIATERHLTVHPEDRLADVTVELLGPGPNYADYNARAIGALHDYMEWR